LLLGSGCRVTEGVASSLDCLVFTLLLYCCVPSVVRSPLLRRAGRSGIEGTSHDL
jgi:hypothetical protein